MNDPLMSARYLLDVNVLLALSLPTHQHHRAATTWLVPGLQWATTPLTETGYLRLMTNPKVTGFDVTVDQALQALGEMRRATGHQFVPDGSSLAEPTIDVSVLVGPKQVTGFHLLNLAASIQMIFATFDASLHRTLVATDRPHVLVLSD